MSPYRGGPPPPDDEPPPDFRAPSSTAADEAFHLIMLGTIPAAATFVVAPMVCAASLACGFLAGAVAYATHDRRRKKQPRAPASENDIDNRFQ